MAVDASNNLFVANLNTNTVREYNASTGALINASFITGLSGPAFIAVVSPVPEPSSMVLVAGAVAAAAGLYRRRAVTAR